MAEGYDRARVDFSDEDHVAAEALNKCIDAFSNDVKGDEWQAAVGAVVTVFQRVSSGRTKQEKLQYLIKIAFANILDEMPKASAE